MTDLAPCTSCKRHVRVGIASCPFCAATVPALRARNSLPRALTRAAIFSAALVGCQSKSTAPNPAAGSAIGSAVHEAPPVADAAEAAGSNAGSSAGSNAAGSNDGSAAADAGVAHAGSGVVSPELRKEKLQRLHEKRVKVKDESQMAKPYGAPPARRRIV